ncbi:dullard protein phosphatase like protein [Babesia gibsoni]|uniref:Dullard protein phosphatase like protein n=1 Tax=Babesia gibsoni TaxID=33632 RepID=A0AAD8UTR9_BABGI|nr:dullard protein phosphatase like protein [Babesia gibsoni]
MSGEGCTVISVMGLNSSRREYLRRIISSFSVSSGLNKFKSHIGSAYSIMDTLGLSVQPKEHPLVLPDALKDLSTEGSSVSSLECDPSRKKTLVLDLDETLVHSSFENTGQHDIALEISGDPKPKTIYVNLRPFAREFIEATTHMYEVAIFTAATPEYANPVIDALDEEGRIKTRLFRDFCTSWNGCFIKDLEIFNRDLKDIIIIDNSPVSYYLHPNNAIPISSWNDNRGDRELLQLLPLLNTLATASDVVPILSERYPTNEETSDIARRNTSYDFLFHQNII